MPLILKRKLPTGTAATTDSTIEPAIDGGGNAKNFAAAPKQDGETSSTAIAASSIPSATAPTPPLTGKKLVIKAPKPPENAPKAPIKEWPPFVAEPYVPHKALFLGKTASECTFCKHPYMQPCNGADKQCGNYAHAAKQGAKA